MSDHDSHAHVIKSIRTYLFVFGALLVGTVLTVWAATLEFNHTHPRFGIAVALVIATVKASLVAAFFMHLVSEKQMIYSVMASTTFFVIGLVALTLWAMHDHPQFTTFWGR
jgi:cytochrome c oxidase subunit 4